MKEVTSTQNEIYKNLKQLATSAKHRRRSEQTLLEGIHLCESYLDSGGRPLMLVHTAAAATDPEVAKIMATCDERNITRIQLSEGNFNAISSVDNGIGILIVVTIQTIETSKVLHNNALLLEDVQDPGNMGAILRTAAAAGITEVYTSAGSASAWAPKVLRAGMGAHFALRIHENCDLAKLIGSSDIHVLATSLNATNTIYQKDLRKPTGWVFGNEGQGVSQTLLDGRVEPVIIPQSQGVESLNVAASVAVCLFEQVRQRSINM